ncbi:MAG TPA: C13 family peptidase [Solimonas sp.]|nr:C13 family peptidase [Solimonas sp.]
MSTPAPGLLQDLRDALRALGAGLRLSLLGRPDVSQLRCAPDLFWLAAALGALLGFALAWWAIEPPRRFERAAFASLGLDLALTLLAALLMARALRRDELLWPIAVLASLAALLPNLVASLMIDHLLVRHPPDDRTWRLWLLYGVMQLWWGGVLFQLLGALDATASRWRRLAAVALALVVLGAPSFLVPQWRFWSLDEAAPYEQDAEGEPEPLVAEEVFARQPALVEQALGSIVRSRPGAPELYFVAFAPYGSQGVFLREAHYSAALFESRFGARGRTLTLANARTEVQQTPLATLTNLRAALRGLARRMDPDKDILFLFLTSHGSADGELSVELEDLGFSALTAEALAQALDEAGIRWRVILVSGCYSGSFIPALKGERTLLMTAAAADRSSFGCSDGADFTWFGRAYFEQALQHTTSFSGGFNEAQKLVFEWEAREHYEHSRPQLAIGAQIEAQLERWRLARLPGSTADER